MVNIYEELSAKRKEQQALGKYPEWFTTGGYQMFKEKYEYEADGYNEQIRRIAKHLAKFSPKFLDKSHPLYETIVKNYGDNWEDCFYTLYYKGDAVPSSPLLANCGTERGSTVSCSGGVTHNSVRGFYDSYKENALLTKEAFGTSTYLGGVQGRGTLTSKGFKATGTKPVLDAHFQMARDVSQGQVRRGSIACYLEIDHIDFDEWADALHKNPQGQNIGWIITKKFIALLNENDEEAHRRFSKALWVKMLTGKGYFWKVDHVNEQQPQMYKDLGLSNKASNLCSEIVLHADEDHTYTCILMSMNCYNFDHWEKSGGVFVATVLLDCLVSDFLDRAKNILGLEKAVRFTEKSRALGLGLYGWHSYLQSKMIGLEEYQAHAENMRVFSHMQEESLQASQWLASELGEPEWCKGYGVRQTHRLAIAPNMSSAVIGGQYSQGIEPWLANVFSQPTAAGEMQRINPELIKLVESKGRTFTKALIKSIVDNKGSIQHLDWLTDQEKLVFKTAFEIDQKVILRLASTRQQFIDQGQSLNLFFSSEEDESYIAEVHKEFLLDDRLKGLYYIRSESGVMSAKDECIACES